MPTGTMIHSAKGSTWKKHKYIRKENGHYYYKELPAGANEFEDSVQDRVMKKKGYNRIPDTMTLPMSGGNTGRYQVTKKPQRTQGRRKGVNGSALPYSPPNSSVRNRKQAVTNMSPDVKRQYTPNGVSRYVSGEKDSMSYPWQKGVGNASGNIKRQYTPPNSSRRAKRDPVGNNTAGTTPYTPANSSRKANKDRVSNNTRGTTPYTPTNSSVLPNKKKATNTSPDTKRQYTPPNSSKKAKSKQVTNNTKGTTPYTPANSSKSPRGTSYTPPNSSKKSKKAQSKIVTNNTSGTTSYTPPNSAKKKVTNTSPQVKRQYTPPNSSKKPKTKKPATKKNTTKKTESAIDKVRNTAMDVASSAAKTVKDTVNSAIKKVKDATVKTTKTKKTSSSKTTKNNKVYMPYAPGSMNTTPSKKKKKSRK